MKHQSIFRKALVFTCGVIFSTTIQAATVALSNAPLIKLTTGEVKPNILFVLDDSGSMTWTYMPDAANNFLGDYGYVSSHCNTVYYDPTITYKAPVSPLSTVAPTVRYSDASFTAAKNDGYDNSGSGAVVNLNNEFIANRFTPENHPINSDANSYWSSYGSYLGGTSVGPFGAVYYEYTGAVTERDYTAGSTFYNECNTPGANQTVGRVTTVFTGGLGASAPFTRVRLSSVEATFIRIQNTSSGDSVSGITVNGVQIMNSSYTSTGWSDTTMAAQVAARITQNGFSATSSGNEITITGPTSAAGYTPAITGAGIDFTTDVFPYTEAEKLTNFANWYSYYRTRALMMKTSAGEAFSGINSDYRLGLMNISSSFPGVPNGTFANTHRESWYNALYGVGYNTVGTPLREALSTAGRYYGKQLGGTDPVQYSCQQNFTILSTDGYYNDSNSDAVKLDGSTQVGNQDSTNPDGSYVNRPEYDGSIGGVTNTYRRYTYSTTRGSGRRNRCSRGRLKLVTQEQRGTCQAASGGACTPSSWRNQGRPSQSSCQNNVSIPNPNPSALTLLSSATSSVGGSSNSLADVARYYYQTDIRDGALSNCTGGTREDGSTGDVCNNGDASGVGGVFSTPRDSKKEQHMTTYTLGLADGVMKYTPNYETASADFIAVRDGSTASSTVCKWQAAGTTCNWPVPSTSNPTTIDDLWHASVNGHGAYFNANNPETLADGIRNTLSGITETKGAASASSSSSLSPSPGDNASFIATYITNSWAGNLESRSINTETGVETRSATWCVESIPQDKCDGGTIVQQTINNTTIYNCETPESVSCADGGGVNDFSGDLTSGTVVCKTQVASACAGTFRTQREDPSFVAALVEDDADSRTIKTPAFNSGASQYELVDFDSTFATANPTYFANALTGLSQWASLDATQQALAQTKILGYLRGHYGFDGADSNNFLPLADNRLFRKRDWVLGDILESRPTFNGKSRFNYGYPGYAAFKAAQNAKTIVQDGTVYTGANDGMLHAFAADTGVERWAYIPSMVVPKLWKLADNEYRGDAEHINFVNGEVSVSDVCMSSCNDTNNAVWKTILVGGLNAGGRGYYALDITDPASPSLLWEFTTTAGIGKTQDDDLGYSYGKPIIARKADNTWVVAVTSGYNNVSPGSGEGYLFVLDVASGDILDKVSTDDPSTSLNVGNTTTPSGLAKIAALNQNQTGNEVGDIFGGDLLGNVWRFDINSSPATASRFATLASAGGTPQPVTTTPIFGAKGSYKLVFITTGKYLESTDRNDTTTQSVYAMKIDGPALTNARLSLVEQTLVNDTVETRTISTVQQVTLATDRGWFADFPDTGERVNIDSILTQGVLTVPTLVPSSTSCAPGGYGWSNSFDFETGAPVGGTIGNKSSSPFAGVGVYYINNVAYIYGTGVDGKNRRIGPTTGGVVGAFEGKRSLWRELRQ